MSVDVFSGQPDGGRVGHAERHNCVELKTPPASIETQGGVYCYGIYLWNGPGDSRRLRMVIGVFVKLTACSQLKKCGVLKWSSIFRTMKPYSITTLLVKL